MTPKEKAKKIFDYMFYAKDKDGSYSVNVDRAKQCALIAVYEIINTLNSDIRDLDVRGNILLDLIEFWKEVKQEIEAL